MSKAYYLSFLSPCFGHSFTKMVLIYWPSKLFSVINRWIPPRLYASYSHLIDADYFHVVFTIPAQLNPLVFANQKPLYSLLHICSAETLLELCENKKYLGATPDIIQILHTWRHKLYSTDWNAEIKKTFNGNGNAIEYLGALCQSHCYHEYKNYFC